MSRWLDRSGYVTVAAFVVGALIAGIVALVVLLVRDGGDGDGSEISATATALPPAATATDAAAGTPTATSIPTAVPTGFSDPDEALAAYVNDQLQSIYIGECPRSLPSGQAPPEGHCSIELYRSDVLVTFNVGRLATEALGEAVVIPNADGSWSLTFLNFPPLDAQIAVGADAMVFQAEDCLRVRAAPTTSASVASCQIDGTRGRVIDGPVDADGETWWRLESLGWASSSYLVPAIV